MIHDNKVDLGSIQIHKKVVADIAGAALSEIEGAHLGPKSLGQQFLEIFSPKSSPGIIVTLDKNGQVSIELMVYINYGINIPDIARQIQDVVRVAVERTTDIHLREINVNVQGIERGKK